MKIRDIVESVESGDIEQHLHLTIRRLAFTLLHFDHYTNTTSYASAITRLASLSYPLDAMLTLLANNNPATAKLAAQYEELRQKALSKIHSGI